MPRFVLRVDDCGWKPTDKSADYGLEYFKRWYSAMGLNGAPIFLGFIPAFTHKHDLQLLSRLLKGREMLAVHGHDHAKGADVTLMQMKQAHGAFGMTPAYIPPFNVYDRQTTQDWSTVVHENSGAQALFFGGFDEANGDRHHAYGDVPVTLHDGKLLHLPALRKLYGRAPNLLQPVMQLQAECVPVVVTLHATWDVTRLDSLRPLVDFLRPNLIGVDELRDWVNTTKLSVNTLTAPHFVAYSYVMNQLRDINMRVMDFGARYSALPAQMALRGARVTAVDRDAGVHQWQQAHAAKLVSKVQLDTSQWDGLSNTDLGMIGLQPGSFDLITACWAIQHNLQPGEIEQVSRNLNMLVKPNGRLVVVTSREPNATRIDTHRADPQVILDDSDFASRVVQAGNWQVTDRMLFSYEHGSTKYVLDEEPAKANAAAYTLIRQ